jgi:hypothetical protein
LQVPKAFTSIQVGKARARIGIQDLKILQDLDLHQQPRVIFGARLASCRKHGGGWLIHFGPETGTLLTHEKAAINQCREWADDESRKLMRAQAKWLAEQH